MITQRQNGRLFTDIKNNFATIEFGLLLGNSYPSELLDIFTTVSKK